MVSPVSAINSRAPAVQALARVAAVAPRPAAVEAVAASAGPTTATASPALNPGARDVLPAGYRNLALPLGAGANGDVASAQGPKSESPLTAAYGPSEASLAELPRLVGNRLPAQVIVREAQAAIRERAEALGQTAEELLDRAPEVASSKLPSRNAPDAETTQRAALLARAGEKETLALDIYLTKTGPSSFEAVTFDRDYAAPAGGFPYSAPPLSYDRILFDPAYAAIVSIASGQAAAREQATARGRLPLGRLMAAALLAAVALLAVAASLGAQRPLAAAASAALGLGALALMLRSRLFR